MIWHTIGSRPNLGMLSNRGALGFLKKVKLWLEAALNGIIETVSNKGKTISEDN